MFVLAQTTSSLVEHVAVNFAYGALRAGRSLAFCMKSKQPSLLVSRTGVRVVHCCGHSASYEINSSKFQNFSLLLLRRDHKKHIHVTTFHMISFCRWNNRVKFQNIDGTGICCVPLRQEERITFRRSVSMSVRTAEGGIGQQQMRKLHCA